MYDRNRELLEIEEEIEQVISDQKQTVKTENEIKKVFTRRKTMNNNKKKTINLMRDMTQK